MLLIESAPHEFEANVQFVEYGLEPFFACDELVEKKDDECSASFTLNGEKWTMSIRSQSSGLAHPGETLPTGEPFPVETLREFRARIQYDGDSVGQRYVDVHLRPRWQGQVDSSGNVIPVPPSIEEGVNLHIRGVNIEFDRYPRLVQRAFTALGLDAAYFSEMHETSTVLDAERYVRIHKNRSGPLVAHNGPLNQLGRVLENDRDGRQQIDQRNTDERGRNVPGYYHTVILTPRALEEVFPEHSLPKQIKHYYAQEAASLDDDEALAHPKLCVKYKRNRWKGKLDVSTAGLEQLARELEETLLSVLQDADLPLRPELGTYVADEYFEPTASNRNREVTDLDLDQVQDRQAVLVGKYLGDGFTPTAWEVLTYLVSDGGRTNPTAIADQIDRHVGSVRRALRRIPELVDYGYNEVALRSPHVAALLSDTIEGAERRLAADDSTTERSQCCDDEQDSALFNWIRKYDIEFADRSEDGSLTIHLGTVSVDDVRRRVREGLHYWKAAGRPEFQYRNAVLVYSVERSNNTTYLPDPKPRQFTTQVWQCLE